jgi:acetylornithine deacetylase/succinyl-diaminopimelate desuccinylase-like protein
VIAARLADAARQLASLPLGEEDDGLPEWAQRLVSLGGATTFVVTQLDAVSGAPNVVAPKGSIDVDVRTAPGEHDSARDRLETVADSAGLSLTLLRDEPGFHSPKTGRVFNVARQALTETLGPTEIVPFVLAAATDGRHFTAAGIDAYGFVPLTVPPAFDPLALMHARDERVPVQSLVDGARVLEEVARRW